MSLLILATILAVGVVRIQAGCPSIQSDSLTGVEGRWYKVYSNIEYPTVKCAYGDISKSGDTYTTNVNIKFDNGESMTVDSTIKKESDGKYYDEWENDDGITQHDITLLKVDGDFLLSWICVDFGDGVIKENAAIHSRNKQTSNAIKEKFSNWLTSKGAQGGTFYESRTDGC
uniref:Venom protein n=1 Tax=Hemiscolopendra marginata TaxID=943146 RepID=A0A646QF75_9MYRI